MLRPQAPSAPAGAPLLIPSPPLHSGLNREGVMEKVSTCSYVRTTEDAVRGFNRIRGSIKGNGTLKIELLRYLS